MNRERGALSVGLRHVCAGLAILLVLLSAGPSHAGAAPPVTVYFNGSCHDCVPYLDQELVPLLRSLGVGEIVRRDYILERRNRSELVERSTALGIPPQLQGHMTTFVGDRIVLQGHVPAQIIRDLLAPAQATRYMRIVVLQDKMPSHGEAPRDYTVWAPGGVIAVYPLGEPVTTYLAGLPQPGDHRSVSRPRRCSP